MAKEKKSFFERLTGSVRLDDEMEESMEDKRPKKLSTKSDSSSNWIEEEEKDGELTVDVYQTPEMIVIKAMIAGVRPEDLDISITRDMVTIEGKRVEQKEVNEEGYVYRELYWGSFARTIVLPAEVDVDMAEAAEKHGLLTIKLPKINKDRQTKLKVRGN